MSRDAIDDIIDSSDEVEALRVEVDRLRKLELSAKLLVGVWERYRGQLPEPIIDELARLREAINSDTTERLAYERETRTDETRFRKRYRRPTQAC